MFFLYPGICSKIFTVFKCILVDDDGSEYLAADLSIQCYVDANGHNTLMGLAGLFMCLYALGIPAVTLYVLWKNKTKIKVRNEHLKTKLGQLYMPYRPTVWFWEVVELA